MRWTTGSSRVEGLLVDWALTLPEAATPLPAAWLDDAEVAAELARSQRNRAREAAPEAELILRLAELRPDGDDPPPGAPGSRRRGWRRTDPELPGVSGFFPDELAHVLNLGRGTAAVRARRARTWQECLPATFAAMHRGEIDERRAGVLADVLQHTGPEVARVVESGLLDEAVDLSLAELRRRALAALAELDAPAVQQRHDEARRAADVRANDTGDGMATLAGDLTVDEAAACYAVVDSLAAMAKADGDPRPIGRLRAAIMAMLILRPAEHGRPGVTVHLAVTAILDGLEGTGSRGGEVDGLGIGAQQLRDLLRRVGALGLTAPNGGSLTVAITDRDGRLLATATPAELARRAGEDCPAHPVRGTGCACPVLGPPAPTDGYEPTVAQRRFATVRDRRCRFPNCGQRVGWADLDHVVPHAHGGRTSCANLCCACRSHHRLTTFASGWSFRMERDGTLHVTSPSGVHRTTRPPGRRPPAPPDDHGTTPRTTRRSEPAGTAGYCSRAGSVACGQRDPVVPGDVPAHEAGPGGQRPLLVQPARHELVEGPLHVAADEAVHDPPRHLGARLALLLRRIDVQAAEHFGLVVLEDAVQEALVRGDVPLVVGEVVAVLLGGHVGRRPAPRPAVDRPEPLPGSHDRREVDLGVGRAHRPHVLAGGQVSAQGVHEVLGEPGHARQDSAGLRR
jgi:hypothetical protein